MIDAFYTAADGSKDWRGIWTAFALYALAMAIAFVPLFRQPKQRVDVVPEHGTADVNAP